jgi:hypothetical protein
MVSLVDFGDAGLLPLAATFELPPEISNIEPQRHRIQLACVDLARPPEETLDAVWRLVRGRKFWMQLAYDDRNCPPGVFLTDKPVGQTRWSLNAELISRGIAKLHKRSTPQWLAQAAADLQAAANGFFH